MGHRCISGTDCRGAYLPIYTEMQLYGFLLRGCTYINTEGRFVRSNYIIFPHILAIAQLHVFHGSFGSN
jgi:hypothetical protein